MSYQWSEWNWSTGGWAALDGASSSESKTVSKSARGTRKFKVSAEHTSGQTAESLPLHITWDEWAIVADMVQALASEVLESKVYKDAYDDLDNCLKNIDSSDDKAKRAAAPTPGTDILSNYTGELKRVIEQHCLNEERILFAAIESQSKSALADMKARNAEYAALLDTPHGADFEAAVGDAYVIKRYISLLTAASPNQPIDDSGAPPSAGASGASGPTGLGCIALSGGKTPTTLQGKLDVLNCLVFDTDYDFWISQPRKKEDSALYRDKKYRDFLGFEKWDCSTWADGPLAACLRHDVAWGSLRKFIGGTEFKMRKGLLGTVLFEISADDTIDETWNPRNKYLADEQFYADIQAKGCVNRTSGLVPWAWCGVNRVGQAFTMQFGVRKINGKSWPYTYYDLEHINSNYKFTEYRIPSVVVDRVWKSGDLYNVSWSYSSGTVGAARVAKYRLCWDLGSVFGEYCPTVSGNATSYSFKPLKIIRSSVKSFKSIEISPERRMLGYFDDVYYPPLEVNREYP
jgi:hypothetical protein